MRTKVYKYLLVVTIAGLLITSCKVTQPYQAPTVKTDSLYRNVTTTDTVTIANLRWSELFTDPALQQLISEGIAKNIDLQVAYNRIQQAQANYSQSKAAFLPSLDANTGVTTSKLSEAQGMGIRTSTTQYQLGVSTAWEADIWGKLKSSKKASLASLLQTDAAAKAVQTQLVASIANYYYQLLALDEQLAITQQTINNWDTTVQTMKALKDAARVTEAAVVQSEAQRYAAEVTLPDLKQSIKEIENALSILLAMPPNAVQRGNLQNQQIVVALQTGIPAQLLANRPDVLQAEYNFRNYFELTNVARTYFYPTLSINGSAGLNSLTLGNLFDASSFVASIGAGLTQPIFNKRANKTRLEVAKLQQQAALLDFQNTLLNAGMEVSNAMSLHETALEKIAIRTNQVTALQKSVDYTQELLKNGFGNTNYTEIITAKQSLLQAELGSVNDRLQRLQAVVNLYSALGGGWK